jgi:hypothetical protein
MRYNKFVQSYCNGSGYRIWVADIDRRVGQRSWYETVDVWTPFHNWGMIQEFTSKGNPSQLCAGARKWSMAWAGWRRRERGCLSQECLQWKRHRIAGAGTACVFRLLPRSADSFKKLERHLSHPIVGVTSRLHSSWRQNALSPVSTVSSVLVLKFIVWLGLGEMKAFVDSLSLGSGALLVAILSTGIVWLLCFLFPASLHKLWAGHRALRSRLLPYWPTGLAGCRFGPNSSGRS